MDRRLKCTATCLGCLNDRENGWKTWVPILFVFIGIFLAIMVVGLISMAIFGDVKETFREGVPVFLFGLMFYGLFTMLGIFMSVMMLMAALVAVLIVAAGLQSLVVCIVNADWEWWCEYEDLDAASLSPRISPEV